jgi:hypothetical protein
LMNEMEKQIREIVKTQTTQAASFLP